MSDHPSDRIVVGVDGSAASDAAVRWAARDAALRNVELTLLHVVQLPAVSGVGYAIAPLPREFIEQQRDEGQRVIDAAHRIVEADFSPSERVVLRDELVTANPIPTLIDATKDAQLIVVGSRGRGAWRRGLFGSASNGLVHHSHCPVAVIRDPADGRVEHEGPVVVGVDGSPASELAVAMAFDEASRRSAELLAVHAWSDAVHSGIPVSAWPDFQPEAEETLAERMAGWQDRYPDVHVHRRVVFNQPARHLLEAAETAQLLVVGSHGRGGFAGMLLGSVSSTVVHATDTPVIVARRG
ncbi:universal stress protein [Mycolicibacterium arenosum]|uniref:Universal stress protein n=1 Tax=Mycolicibacterium arenosum TaxID=2952157 RepID=A0ABT1LZB3_9MYCO|nr:universal stress protein [Mycolicibacterium sp. CAU 1645]MCP9270942.1 universal stress protein [Mycolicibacterium sp. CAU 1645]